MKKYISHFFTFALFIFAMVIVARYKATPPYALIFNTIQFLLIFSAAFVLSGQWLRAINFSSIFTICVYYLSNLTYHFYKKPLFISDFLVFFDVSNWPIVFEYKSLIFIILIYILVLGYGVWAYRNTKKSSFKIRFGFLVFFIFLIFLDAFLIQTKLMKEHWAKTFPHAKEISMNLAMSFGSLEYSSPKFGDNYEYFKEKMRDVKPYKTSNLKPNLVLWLQESTVDASLYEPNLKQVPMFEGSEFKFKAFNRVHTFGGETFRSEFEILTGLNPDDFGSGSSTIFYSGTKHIKYSLPKLLKEQGYFVVALNPLLPNFFNVYNAYMDLGVDKYYHPSNLDCDNGEGYKNLWHLNSENFSKCVKKIYELHSSSKPLFIYATTINEHVPYNRHEKPKFGLKNTVLSDYYERQIELSNATMDFDKFMQRSKKPYVFAYFGDHQGLLGFKEKDLNLPYKNQLFITGFYVKGSKEINASIWDDLGELGLNTATLLELMQIKPNEHFEAIYAMKKLCGGVDDCENKELVKSYKSYIYDYLKSASKE
ncbi:phosphoglycerol transferase [Campylobacter iguaniorum]|uniref:sulfatase-like hydrolase/transferase n=1 Tax=Campylobacter iguaniorum TaxID=1244531 RepID=UPI00073ADFAE|nr:sulfatase-like hydrolase/transferase [Campylobacter iguaniorum]ALV25353.1 phosphoglycerol transferase [Campylobacter iguaniorum]